ncbi:MAG: cation transport ATPase [Lentimonas sp.]|jgi:cation transport ATPase
MFKKLVFITALMFFANLAFAKTIDIDVNGLVCEFCAVTIDKTFMKKDEIEKVEVDLDAKKVLLHFKENQDLSDEEITETIINNGYNVVKINR